MTGYCAIKGRGGGVQEGVVFERKDEFGLGEVGKSLGWDFWSIEPEPQHCQGWKREVENL